MGFYMGYGYNGWWMVLMMIGGLLVTFAIIYLFVWAITRATQQQIPAQFQTKQQPIDILNERFARGEIDSQTYQQMKGTIEQRGNSGQ